ncbi:MAG: GNAT family N-acetyltransferase [Marinibacterium sp.]
MVTIAAAQTDEHRQDFSLLVQEFASWAVSTFHHDQAASPPVFAALEQELSLLPGKYAIPEGGLYVAHVDDDVAGCVAGFKTGQGDFEVTRLWVRPGFRGMAIGDALVDAVLTGASRAGYERSILRSRREMTSAHRIYRRAGCVDVDGRACFANFADHEIAMRRDLV